MTSPHRYPTQAGLGSALLLGLASTGWASTGTTIEAARDPVSQFLVFTMFLLSMLALTMMAIVTDPQAHPTSSRMLCRGWIIMLSLATLCGGVALATELEAGPQLMGFGLLSALAYAIFATIECVLRETKPAPTMATLKAGD